MFLQGMIERAFLAALFAGATMSSGANGQEPPTVDRAPPAEPTHAPPAEVLPAKDTERSVSLVPKAAEQPPEGRARFEVDPIADASLIGVSAGFALVLELIISTGEVRPQQIAPDFDRSRLVAIDRASITATPDRHAGALSNLGLGAAVAFAVADPILSGLREKSVQTALVDGILYAESAALTSALTDMVKLAVRRPRPRAYIDAQNDPSYSNSSTDSALSFFSGHASMTAALGATATYLAFTRSPHTLRPWVTLVLATGLTTFVSIERVRAGKHFPTDVIAGSVAGAGVGVIVPHLHRAEDVAQRRVWIGFAPVNGREGERGGTLRVSGSF
jgi:membrane-associated phospholipid phosphatase